MAETKLLPYSTALSERDEATEGWVTSETSTRVKTSGMRWRHQSAGRRRSWETG